MLMTTDTRLVARAAAGDRDAFDTVYAAAFGCVYAFAVRRSDGERAAAESLAERILRRVFADLDRYDGQVPFAAWLLALARDVDRDGDRGAPTTRGVHRAGRRSGALRYPAVPSRR
jgi:DNA-directed RNA polymerase specialized sigma24 family protein